MPAIGQKLTLSLMVNKGHASSVCGQYCGAQMSTSVIPPAPKYMNAELESILLKHGGLFHLAGDDNELTKQLFNTVVSIFTRHRDYAQLHLYTDKPRPIEFGFTCESSLNAFAYATPSGAPDEFDFIGINVGVIFTLMDVFLRMLSHPDIFPEVGTPDKESRSVHNLANLTTDIMRSGFTHRSGPNCPVRRIFAGELTKVALDFLFFHELTHLLNGHLEFCRENFLCNYWSEAFGQSTQNEHKMIRQTLELDADSGAVLLSLNAAYQMKDLFLSSTNTVPPDLHSAVRSAYGSAKSATRIVSFASYILFRIFDTPEWFWHLQPQQSHPLPPIRMFLIAPTLCEIFRQRPEYGYDPNSFISDNSEFMISAEVACGLIRGDQPDMRGIASVVRDGMYTQYINQFEAQWKKIRPILDKYKRGGNLPP
jgi:hypothetical protein